MCPVLAAGRINLKAVPLANNSSPPLGFCFLSTPQEAVGYSNDQESLPSFLAAPEDPL